VIAALSAAGSVASGHVNIGLFRGQYPTLHLSLLQIEYLLLQVMLTHAFVLAERGHHGEVTSRRLLAGAAGLASLSAVTMASVDDTKGLPYLTANTTLGPIDIVQSPYSEDREVSAAKPRGDAGDVARFERLSALPLRPPDFRLENYNILLLTSEALRFDQTSLADPALATTPRLAALRDAGAFLFTRAYSPSSGTLASIRRGTMTYPSMFRSKPHMAVARNSSERGGHRRGILSRAGQHFQVDTNMMIT
jgi:hypothetical protein